MPLCPSVMKGGSHGEHAQSELSAMAARFRVVVKNINATLLVSLKCWDEFLHASGFVNVFSFNVVVGYKLYGHDVLECYVQFSEYIRRLKCWCASSQCSCWQIFITFTLITMLT